MPWKEVSAVSQREHFFDLWASGSHTMTALCQLFNISRKTGYKWVARIQASGVRDFEDRSRRPAHSPNKTSDAIERQVIRQRQKYPDWGGRKLKRLLENQGKTSIPAASTITAILRRQDLLEERVREADHPRRFEHSYANSLWQMDFKGHFAMSRGRCHPLTVLDDHSRFNAVLKACSNETARTVKHALIEAFERYGLPDRMTMDNGSPWGNKLEGRYTKFTVWLMDLGIQVSHSRPYHPQTQGKDERFHRTLKAEVLSRRHFCHIQHCQKAFDEWSDTYNYVRPHDALGLEVPASRYTVSHRPYQGWDLDYPYTDDAILRKVTHSGAISYRSQKCYLGEAFAGRWVALKPTIKQDKFEIYYRHQRIAKVVVDV